MKNLSVWQLVSVVSRFSATFFGILQSIVIARILSVSEFGVVGIVGAIGALFGIAQHLGLASGTTKEISSSKDYGRITKIFLASFLIKYSITIPLFLVLFIFAPYIAINIYHHSEIILPIRLYAIVLVVQGVQSIFNSVIAGLQQFKKLFIYQTAIAALSLFIYIPLVYLYKVDGYFYALLIFNIVGSVSLGILALYPLRGKMSSPGTSDFKSIFKSILYLSAGIYFVKVLYTIWYKFGQLTLGRLELLETVGVFSFGLLYASKLMTISDALTDVNLPVFSKTYSESLTEFVKLFRRNFNKVYIFILFCAVGATFFSKDILHFAVGTKYDSSLVIIPFLIFSFVSYSYINLLKSSVFIPSSNLFGMSVSYIVMLVSTVISYFVFRGVGSEITVMSGSMFTGALFGFIFMIVFIKHKLNFFVIDKNIFWLTIFVLIPLLTGYENQSFLIKLVLFSIYSILLALFLKKSNILQFRENE